MKIIISAFSDYNESCAGRTFITFSKDTFSGFLLLNCQSTTAQSALRLKRKKRGDLIEGVAAMTVRCVPLTMKLPKICILTVRAIGS